MRIEEFINLIENEKTILSVNGLVKPDPKMLTLLHELCSIDGVITIKKDRQVGMSTLWKFLAIYKLLFDESNTNIAFVATKLENGRNEMKMLKRLFEQIIKLTCENVDISYITNNREQMIFQINGYVKIITVVSQHGLFNNLRGKKYDYIFCDEIDYWYYSPDRLNIYMIEQDPGDKPDEMIFNKSLLKNFTNITQTVMFWGYSNINERYHSKLGDGDYSKSFLMWLLTSNASNKKYYFMREPKMWCEIE